MSSRSTTKSATSLVEFDDVPVDESVMSVATDSHGEETTTQQVEVGEADQQSDAVATLGSNISGAVTEHQSGARAGDGVDHTTEPEILADDLAQQLDELVRSVGVVEELSRRAREAECRVVRADSGVAALRAVHQESVDFVPAQLDDAGYEWVRYRAGNAPFTRDASAADHRDETA